LQGVPGFPNLKGGIVFASPNSRHVVETDYRNFGPRLGFAYRLTPTTVIRGGYGIYYSLSQYGAAGTGPGGLTGFDGVTGWPTARPGQPSTPWGMLRNPFPNGLVFPLGSQLGLSTNIGQGIGGPARNGNIMPSMQTWSLGLQHEFPGRILVDASYVGTKGTHLYFAGGGELNHHGPWIETATPAQLTDLNTYVPNPFFGIITDPTSDLSADMVAQGQLKLPYPQYTGVTLFPPAVANSIYHAFQLRVEKRLSQGLQMLLNYTNSKAIDDASMSTYTGWMGGFSSLVDPNNRKLERSVSEFDIPQVLSIGYVYQLPWGRGKKWGTHWNPWLDGFLGGWQTNGFWRFDNGQPITLKVSGAHNLPTYGDSRPNLLAPLRRNNGSDWMDKYFANPEDAVVPPEYTVGTAPRMLPNVRVPGTNTAALSLFKEISLSKIREGTRLEFRAETFNAFNHPQFCGPDTTVNTDNFGQVTSQCNSPREVQLALKFYF
jgi:hypothetical protein